MIGAAIIAASETSNEGIDVPTMVMTLLGGLAIFLIGMDRMTEALRQIAGPRMRDILARLTTNRFAGLLTGAGVTAIIQSSSVTTVLVVGFITSGLMTMSQSLGVIIGANIGTTVTAQIVAFKVTSYALAGVAIGFALEFISRRNRVKAQGTAILGLGLVFFGMSLMGDAMSPLKSSPAAIDVMAQLENPLIGIAVAAAFTALVQSSSATTGIVIVLAQQGLIGLDSGVALILGANIGTSVTAILASIGKPIDAKRAAAAHTTFNVAGVLIWIPAISLLTDMVSGIGGPVERQIANAHTLFNVANALIFIWFTPQIARLVTGLVPEDTQTNQVIDIKYLDQGLFRTPELALARARLEISRMATRTQAMVERVLPAILDGTRWDLLEIRELDEEVDALHTEIIDYLRQLATERTGRIYEVELSNMMEAANNLESAADLVETNLVDLGLERVDLGLVVSDHTRVILTDLHKAVIEGIKSALVALETRDPDAVHRVDRLKLEIGELERAAAQHQNERLLADAPDRVATYRFEIELITNMKRIHYFSRRTARAVAPAAPKRRVTSLQPST